MDKAQGKRPRWELGPPDSEGPVGCAWRFIGVLAPGLSEDDSPIAGEWAVWCPEVSALADHWLVNVMRLGRFVDIDLPSYGAGLTLALNIIRCGPHPATGAMDPRSGDLAIWPRPNLIFQFDASGPEQARAFLDAVAGACVAGTVFPECGEIGGSGPYHAETLARFLEAADPGYHLTRPARPQAVLKQAEYARKTWTIGRNMLGGQELDRNRG